MSERVDACKCCGRALVEEDDRVDGLCFWQDTEGGEFPDACTVRFGAWVLAGGFGFYHLDAPEAAVQIDQWLAEGAP